MDDFIGEGERAEFLAMGPMPAASAMPLTVEDMAEHISGVAETMGTYRGSAVLRKLQYRMARTFWPGAEAAGGGR